MASDYPWQNIWFLVELLVSLQNIYICFIYDTCSACIAILIHNPYTHVCMVPLLGSADRSVFTE